MAAFTLEEIRGFLSSGVIGAEWPKGEAFIWAVVKDKEDKIIHQQKYVHQRQQQPMPHAEIQFIEALENGYQGDRLVEKAKKIELLVNYSPCDGCAPELLDLQSNHPNLKIVIKCAYLFNVYHRDENKARENFEGLKSLQAEDIQIETFSGEDWARLLHEATVEFKECYMHRVLKELGFCDDFIEGREKTDRNIRNALQECQDGATLARIQQVYDTTKLSNPTYKHITLPRNTTEGLKRKRQRE